ncbi:hypothetical protein VAEKB19_5420019 [Vibrio aestuarianus]|nr:hypothetical protein VAEKB19_5420019 [Vibrio aestuarianus]
MNQDHTFLIIIFNPFKNTPKHFYSILLKSLKTQSITKLVQLRPSHPLSKIKR